MHLYLGNHQLFILYLCKGPARLRDSQLLWISLEKLLDLKLHKGGNCAYVTQYVSRMIEELAGVFLGDVSVSSTD